MHPEKKKTLWAAWISFFSNVALTAIKILVGFFFKSQVLIADGVHNAGDVIASATALSAMRISNRPADDDHPYGHGKAEVIASAVIAIILAMAAVFMAYNSIEVLLQPEAPVPHLIALGAALVSLFWKWWLYVYTMRLGKQSNSKSLIATAQDHLADIYASLAAVVGIGLGLVGIYMDQPLLSYGDPIAGIVVSFLVLRLAYHMGRESFDVLMEHSVEQEKLEDYAEIIHSVPEVKRIDRLRAREHGHYIIVDVRIGVSGSLTVQEGHDIGRDIKNAIQDSHKDVGEVMVHLNPWYEEENRKAKQPV